MLAGLELPFPSVVTPLEANIIQVHMTSYKCNVSYS
jgi:hypothetical protein